MFLLYFVYAVAQAIVATRMTCNAEKYPIDPEAKLGLVILYAVLAPLVTCILAWDILLPLLD